jgi:hypothetical protein
MLTDAPWAGHVVHPDHGLEPMDMTIWVGHIEQVRYGVKTLSTSSLTVVLQLQNFALVNLSTSTVPVTAQCVVSFSTTVPTSCASSVQTITKAFGFVNNYKGHGPTYSFSVNPRGLTKGQSYYLLVQTGSDPILHAIDELASSPDPPPPPIRSFEQVVHLRAGEGPDSVNRLFSRTPCLQRRIVKRWLRLNSESAEIGRFCGLSLSSTGEGLNKADWPIADDRDIDGEMFALSHVESTIRGSQIDDLVEDVPRTWYVGQRGMLSARQVTIE